MDGAPHNAHTRHILLIYQMLNQYPVNADLGLCVGLTGKRLQRGCCMPDQIEPTLKARVLSRIKAGEMTIIEAAYVFELDRVTVWRWCKTARISPSEARQRWLVREQQGQNHKPAPRPHSKARQRQVITQAEANTDPAHLAAITRKKKHKPAT
jgi:hypothetical protein